VLARMVQLVARHRIDRARLPGCCRHILRIVRTHETIALSAVVEIGLQGLLQAARVDAHRGVDLTEPERLLCGTVVA
jgi:hypothetical protein